MLTSAALGWLLFGGDPSAVGVSAFVVVAGAATAVFDPTYAATVPTVVDDGDLPAANGLNMANSAVGGLAGPLLGGLLIGVVDIGWVMVVNAATFAWSAAFVWRCRLPKVATAHSDVGPVEQPTDGVARWRSSTASPDCDHCWAWAPR